MNVDEGGPSVYEPGVLDERTVLDGFMGSDARGGNRAQVLTVVGALGFATLIYLLIGVASTPWALDASSPTTTSVESSDSGCDWQRGGQYEIEVDGTRYQGCGGAANKCAWGEAVEIAYDATDPTQCRVAAHVDGLSPYEGTTLLVALSMSLVGFAGLAFLWSTRVRIKAIADGAQALPPRFKRLQLASWLSLALAVLTINATAIFALL